MTNNETLQALQAEIAQLKAAKLEAEQIAEAKREIEQLKTEAVIAEEAPATEKTKITTGQTLGILAIGAVLAPFTGGVSLAYAGTTLAIGSVVNHVEEQKANS